MLIEQPIRAVYFDGNATSHFRPVRDSLRIYLVFSRFTLSSLGCSLLDYLVFWGLLAAGAPLAAALVTARAVSVSANFLTNRRWVFRSGSGIVRQLVRYLLLAAVLLALSYTGIRWLRDWGGVPPAAGKIPVECLLFLLSFLTQEYWVFASDRRPEKPAA